MNLVIDAVKKAGEAAKGIIDGTAAQSKNYLVKNAFATGRLCPNEIKTSMQHGIVYFLRKSELNPLKSVILSSEFSSSQQYRFHTNDGVLPPNLNVPAFELECMAIDAFRRIMLEYDINPSLLINSFLHGDLRDFANPAKSGSLFFTTSDSEFIIKTVRDYEAVFFKSGLLNDYYHNLAKRKESFLARYYGMYAYTQQASLLTLRFVIMSNIVPPALPISERYDLKGSTKGRSAPIEERFKSQGTFKDLDFMSRHPRGLQLPPDIYDRLFCVIRDDVEILHGWKIMDYSLYLAIYNLSNSVTGDCNQQYDRSVLTEIGQAAKSTIAALPYLSSWDFMNFANKQKYKPEFPSKSVDPCNCLSSNNTPGWNFPLAKLYTNDISSARIFDDPVAKQYGGIPAVNEKGEKLLLFIGIIDILQTYDSSKQFQQFFQGINDQDEYSRSIIDPDQYSTRFINFIFGKVFQRGSSDLGTNRIGSFRSSSIESGVSAGLQSRVSKYPDVQMRINKHSCDISSPLCSGYSTRQDYSGYPPRQHSQMRLNSVCCEGLYSAPSISHAPLYTSPMENAYDSSIQQHEYAYPGFAPTSQPMPNDEIGDRKPPYPVVHQSSLGFISPPVNAPNPIGNESVNLPYPTTVQSFPNPEDCIRRSTIVSSSSTYQSPPSLPSMPSLPESVERNIRRDSRVNTPRTNLPPLPNLPQAHSREEHF